MGEGEELDCKADFWRLGVVHEICRKGGCGVALWLVGCNFILKINLCERSDALARIHVAGKCCHSF